MDHATGLPLGWMMVQDCASSSYYYLEVVTGNCYQVPPESVVSSIHVKKK